MKYNIICVKQGISSRSVHTNNFGRCSALKEIKEEKKGSLMI